MRNACLLGSPAVKRTKIMEMEMREIAVIQSRRVSVLSTLTPYTRKRL